MPMAAIGTGFLNIIGQKKSDLNVANCFKITYLLGIISGYLGLHLETEVIVVRELKVDPKITNFLLFKQIVEILGFDGMWAQIYNTVLSPVKVTLDYWQPS